MPHISTLAMGNFRPAKIDRLNAEPLGDILKLFVAQNRLGEGLERQAVFQAWDEASGAACQTVGRFFRDGTLYVTLSSSLVRRELMFQKEFLLSTLNRILSESPTLQAAGLECKVKNIVMH